MQKEVYTHSRPSKLQPVADYSITTQCTHREKDQDLPLLPSTLEAQETYTHNETQLWNTLCPPGKETLYRIPIQIKQTGYVIKHLCSRSDAPTLERQGTATANPQNQRKLTFILQLFPMRLETMSSTILQKIWHRTLSTQLNETLKLLPLFIPNQKKGRKSQKLQMHLHLHLHIHLHLHLLWRESRNSPTLQDPESQ